MINVTNGFLNELFNGNRNYYLYLTINLKDGTTLNLTNKSIWGGGFSVEDAVSGDDNFDVGSAIINKGTFILNNIYDEFSTYDFTEATVMPEVGLMVNGSVEKIKKGKFIVDEATYDDSLITLNCFDNMIMLDKEVDASLFNYPMTLRNIVTTICSACNVLLAASSQEFPHYSFQIPSAPDIDACTYRELLSWVAQIAGCYARFNTDGNLELKWYDFDALNSIDDWLDGGRFDGNSREFQRKIGEIDSEIQPYLNTEVGMTTLRSSYSDDDWKGVGNDIDFEFNGSVKDNIFVDTNSCFAFTNSWPSQSGRLASVDVNVLRRDGSASKIKYQTITSNGYRIKKFLFSGHIVYGSGLTDDKKLEYEIFFVNDGVIAINFITLPTNTSYTMDSSILENGTKYPFTPTQDGVLYLVRNTNGEWESVSNSAYTSGDVADGGSFNPWDTGYVFDAGGFNDASDAVHYLTAVQSHTISVDDVVITGVRIFVETESQENGRTSTPYITGTDDYVIEIDRNPLITESNVQSILAWLGTQLIGTTFRKANLSIQSNPSIEAGDVAVAFDRKGNCYKIVVSRSDFTAFDSQQIVSSAKSPVRNASQRIPESTRTIAKVIKEYKEELSAYDVGVKMITDFMSQSIGYYKTDVIESGATVTYLHDKATLAQSTKVWKRTVDGFATSLDGGQTWISGWTYDGNIVVNHIATHGVSADWIKTGALSVKKTIGGVSKELLNIDAETGNVVMKKSDGTKVLEFNASSGELTLSPTTFTLTAANTSTIDDMITDKGYQTGTQVETRITNKGYQTSTQVETAITGKGYQTESQVQTKIEANIDSIRLQAKTITWTSTNSSMTADGKLTCENAYIKGEFRSDIISGYLTIKQGEVRGYYNDTLVGYLDLQSNWQDGNHVVLSSPNSKLIFGAKTALQVINPATNMLKADYDISIAQLKTGLVHLSTSYSSLTPAHVALSIEDKFWVTYAGILYKQGDYSDENSKKDIVHFGTSYKELFMKLNPISYKWKEGNSKYTYFGVGARETERYIHELGMKDLSLAHDNDGSYSVDYNALFTLMIPIVQEHENVIASLKQEICELKEEIAQLKSAS